MCLLCMFHRQTADRRTHIHTHTRARNIFNATFPRSCHGMQNVAIISTNRNFAEEDTERSTARLVGPFLSERRNLLTPESARYARNVRATRKPGTERSTQEPALYSSLQSHRGRRVCGTSLFLLIDRREWVLSRQLLQGDLTLSLSLLFLPF